MIPRLESVGAVRFRSRLGCLTVLSARGDIVRGPNDGSWTTSRPRWITTADGSACNPPEPAMPQAELVRRWLDVRARHRRGHQVVVRHHADRDPRKALTDIDAVDVDLHGSPGYALPDDLQPEPEVPPWGALLPGWTPPPWAGSTATGTSVTTAPRCSTETAMPGPPRGGTDGWWAAGIRTRTPACSCS